MTINDPMTNTQHHDTGGTMSIPNALPTLSAGAHRPNDGEACVMEYVSLLAGEEWSDTPSCTYPPLAKAAQVVNDRLSDADRHLLVPLIGQLFGTTLPVDDRLFALRVARTVEHLSAVAKACNDVTERFLAGQATEAELQKARSAAANATDATYYAAAAADACATRAASYAARAACATTAAGVATAYAAADAATTSAAADAATSADAAATDVVAWLATVIDVYDELSGRTEHREVSNSELAELALAVQR